MSWETLIVAAGGVLEGVALYLIKRYFDKRDKRDEKTAAANEAMREQVKNGLETIRLLAYSRLSEEIERLLTKGFATPAERRILSEMEDNYKAHGWNGDMSSRLKKAYALRTDHAPEEE